MGITVVSALPVHAQYYVDECTGKCLKVPISEYAYQPCHPTTAEVYWQANQQLNKEEGLELIDFYFWWLKDNSERLFHLQQMGLVGTND